MLVGRSVEVAVLIFDCLGTRFMFYLVGLEFATKARGSLGPTFFPRARGPESQNPSQPASNARFKKIESWGTYCIFLPLSATFPPVLSSNSTVLTVGIFIRLERGVYNLNVDNPNLTSPIDGILANRGLSFAEASRLLRKGDRGIPFRLLLPWASTTIGIPHSSSSTIL